MLFSHIDIIDENLEYQKDMFVGTSGDCIAYVGKNAPSEADCIRFGDKYDGRGKLLMSGFFNTHAHSSMTLLRGYAENKPLQEWLYDIIFPYEGCLEPGQFKWGTLLAEAEMLRYGVVSYTDMYFSTIERCDASLKTKMKVNHSAAASMFLTAEEYKKHPQFEMDKILARDYHNAGEGKLKVDVSIHGEYTMKEDTIMLVTDLASQNNQRLHMHVSETKLEHEECKIRHKGMTPVQYYNQLGILDIPTTAAHCVWVDEDDIALLSEKKVSVSLNPASNYKLASGFAPVSAFLEAGINTTLGTDGMASNNTHNILQSAYMLSCVQKAVDMNPTVITPRQILQMLTRNGALSQGREDCGILAEGYKADLIVMDINNPWMRPVHNMLNNVIYSGNASDICLTMCDGEVLYENGTYHTIDIEHVGYECDRVVEKTLMKLKA